MACSTAENASNNNPPTRYICGSSPAHVVPGLQMKIYCALCTVLQKDDVINAIKESELIQYN